MSSRTLNFAGCASNKRRTIVKKERPVDLNIGAFRWPMPALMSITHRLTGVFLFAGVGLLIWMLDESLSSAQGFADAKELFSSGLAKFALWFVLAALAYHTVVGVKHFLMDMGIGESLESGLLASKIALAVSLVLILLIGVWIW